MFFKDYAVKMVKQRKAFNVVDLSFDDKTAEY